ncbi:MAG: 2Fe-2S iron-sulfur cluster-binding protein [Verrucomicrobiales bacterium]|nr:2Fe-2S iron-sulfur cluster-binding protein [Verrucomicrobiales bacterium]
MARLTFITESGDNVVADDAFGTLMEVARDHEVEGIDGACGGVCSCATCHVKVHPDWLAKVGPATEVEQELLDLEDETDNRSRLSCQIEVTEELDGLVVEVVTL